MIVCRFVNLRIGPYVDAEWDYGGIPIWLAYKDGIHYRTYDDQWMNAVYAWFGLVVQQTRNYFADHGGPIVLAQVENELNPNVDKRYIQWNGDMANGFVPTIPWYDISIHRYTHTYMQTHVSCHTIPCHTIPCNHISYSIISIYYLILCVSYLCLCVVRVYGMYDALK